MEEGRSMRRLWLIALFALTACAVPVHPTYEFETGYWPNVAPPTAVAADLQAYASQICGAVGYKVLDRIFVGEYGPSYVRIRFACA
jgi:hypothetical protein